MSMQKPLEGLLRPPIEWFSSMTALVFAGLIYFLPEYFLLSPFSSKIVWSGLLAFAFIRFWEGLYIVRYQWQLKRMPLYEMSSKETPVSNQFLFLGKGFLWKTIHTQRLRDLDVDYNAHYKYPNFLKEWAKAKTFAWENKPYLSQMIPLLKIDHPLNPFRPYPPLGGETVIHGVGGLEEKEVVIPLEERASHVVVLGQPGVGKTRFAETLITQDIRRGDVVIVFDPKGDAELLRRIIIEAKLAGRSDDVMVFYLGCPEHSCRYNPVGNFTRITETANRISNQLPSSGDSAAFKEFGWQFINSIAMVLVAMGKKPDYQTIKFYITKMDKLLEKYLAFWLPTIDKNFMVWVDDYIEQYSTEKRRITKFAALIAYVEHHHLTDNPIFDDLYQANKYDREYFSKITASLNPLLKKLTSGQVAQLLSPDYADLKDERPILDWMQAIRSKKIVYVGLDSLSDREVAAAVGNAMLSDLVSVAGQIYKFGLYYGFYPQTNPLPNPRVAIHADEFNDIIGSEFIPLLNKARGAGFTTVAYTQTWSDVEAKLGNQAQAGQVAGNLGTVVMFRCKEALTVDMLLNQLPEVPIWQVTPNSSVQDTPLGVGGIYYHSTNQDQLTKVNKRFIEQSDVLNLPKGQAFCLLEGGKLYKIRMPLPKSENMLLSKNMNFLMSRMKTIETQQKEQGHE